MVNPQTERLHCGCRTGPDRGNGGLCRPGSLPEYGCQSLLYGIDADEYGQLVALQGSNQRGKRTVVNRSRNGNGGHSDRVKSARRQPVTQTLRLPGRPGHQHPRPVNHPATLAV
jgi:hypothetical protein